MRIPSALLRSDLVIEDWIEAGAFGSGYGPARHAKAQVQPTTRAIIGSDGRTLRADVLILARPEIVAPRPESRLHLAGSSDFWRVLDCALVPDAHRPTHLEILAATTGSHGRPGGSGSGSGA